LRNTLLGKPVVIVDAPEPAPVQFGPPLVAALPVELRFPDEPPRELYPGGPEGLRIAATVKEVPCRCGHPSIIGMEIPVALAMQQDMEPGLFDRVLRQIARRSAQEYAREHDCLACAPAGAE
jgi:hypothetical protein